MNVSEDDIAAVLNQPAEFELKRTDFRFEQGDPYPHGIKGVVVETPPYDGGTKPRTKYCLRYTKNGASRYVNIRPEHVKSINSETNPILIKLELQHGGGGGCYRDSVETMHK